MATLGLFSPELVPKAWFDPELYPLAWFDPTLVGADTNVTVQDEPAYVSTFVGVETVGFYVAGDVAVVVQAVAPAEAEAVLVVTDTGVFVEAVAASESVELYVASDSAVAVEAFVGIEDLAVVYLVDDAAVLVGVETPNEVVSTSSEDPSVAVDVFLGVEVFTQNALDVSVNLVAWAAAESAAVFVVGDAGLFVSVEPSAESIGLYVVSDGEAEALALAPSESAAYLEVLDASAEVEALAASESASYLEVLDAAAEVTAPVFAEAVTVPAADVEDVSVLALAQAPAESASIAPDPAPVATPRPVLAGGTPLEDYEVGGYTLRELREVRESLLEEIIELPVREESAEDKREREAGEPRFSEFLKRIIEEPVKPKAEKKPTNWLPAVAIGAFLLGAWLATSGESEAFAGEEPEDDLLPDDPPDDGLDLDDDLLFEGETLPLQGPEHAGELSELPELPELVESIEFRGEDFQEGEIPLESLSPEVADEELLRSIRQEIEEPEPKKAPKKRRAAKTKPLTREPETVLAYRPGRGRP